MTERVADSPDVDRPNSTADEVTDVDAWLGRLKLILIPSGELPTGDEADGGLAVTGTSPDEDV